MNKWMTYLLIFVAGFVIISVWSFWIIIHPPKITSDRLPSNYSLPYEDVTIKALDSTALAGWLIQSPTEGKKLIIILHGYPADKSDMLNIAAKLYPDFSLLLLDLRYFGESDGAYTTLGIRERDDIKKAIDFAVDKGYDQIGIFGFSLGGALGIMTAAEDERINAVSSYASYAGLRKLGQETYRNLWLLKYPLVDLINIWSTLFLGTPLASISPVQSAKELTIPTFIIHSKQDEQISFSHAMKLEEVLKKNENAEFYFLDSELHGHLPLDFDTRVKDFFSRSLLTN